MITLGPACGTSRKLRKALFRGSPLTSGLFAGLMPGGGQAATSEGAAVVSMVGREGNMENIGKCLDSFCFF